MKRIFLLGFAFALVVALAPLRAAGQEPAGHPQTKLVVQVEYFKGSSPAYDSVPGGGWYFRFMTTAAAKQRGAADTVRAVDVETRLVGGRVEIKVGVQVGEKQIDRLDPVGTYYAAEGETVTASDLERFGVVPFVFRVLRVDEISAAPPVVVNKTQSVGAEITDFTSSPIPSTKLILRNLSSKGVRAVNVNMVAGNRGHLTRLVAEEEGKILIGPGETHTLTLGPTVGRRSSPGNFTPEPLQSVVVATAVFDDYTYEGEVGPAIGKKSLDEGQRVQLTRIMPLVEEAQASADVESVGAIEKFRAAVSALDDEIPQSAVDAISKQFQPLPAGQNQIRVASEVSMHRVKRELLDDLDAFEKKFRSAPTENSFKQWLKARQERFEAWSSRL